MKQKVSKTKLNTFLLEKVGMAKNNSTIVPAEQVPEQFPPSKPASDLEGRRSRCHFWGSETGDSIQVGAGARQESMRKCPEPCLEHPHGLCQALGLLPLLPSQAHPQETAVARMWCLAQQEDDQECSGTLQNPCKTATGGLIKNESIL